DGPLRRRQDHAGPALADHDGTVPRGNAVGRRLALDGGGPMAGTLPRLARSVHRQRRSPYAVPTPHGCHVARRTGLRGLRVRRGFLWDVPGILDCPPEIAAFGAAPQIRHVTVR